MNERVEINPNIMLGKPVIKGTRIPVYMVVDMVAEGISYKEILENYPRLQEEDIYAALKYASKFLNIKQRVITSNDVSSG